ncbi:MAG: NACHT domain-containing protein, partial [Erythrobacter sp.]|nr:NACHT domain-containing protein [Erythrobacter sp.]
MATISQNKPLQKPGDELRDLAARLLSYRYGDPRTEMRSLGKKADVIFESKELGKMHRLYVEAKDYKKALTRSQVSQIYSDYSGILEKNRPSRLLIVTRNGVTTDAFAYVDEERFDVVHQSISELERSILGLEEYIRHLGGIFFEGGLSQYYIDARAHKVQYSGKSEIERQYSELSFNIFEEIQGWVDTESKVPIAVLGGYGDGKSSLAKRIAAEFAAIAQNNALARIPVLIRLGQFSRAAGIESLISTQFASDFSVNNFNIGIFLDSMRRGRFLFICDGFDEMKHAMTWNDFRAMMFELNRLSEGRSKLIILGRPNAFLTDDEHLHVLQGVRRVSGRVRNLADWPKFSEWQLAPFNKDERDSFIDRYLSYIFSSGGQGECDAHPSLDDERIESAKSLATREPEIFSKPVHAKILTELAADPAFDIETFSEGITRWHLYQEFFASLFERESLKEARRPISERQRQRFLGQLAVWLWTEKSGVTSFSVDELPDRFNELAEVSHTDDPETRLREYLTGSFLEKKSGDIFYFGHRSFAEFLVARMLVQGDWIGLTHGDVARILKGPVLDFF